MKGQMPYLCMASSLSRWDVRVRRNGHGDEAAERVSLFPEPSVGTIAGAVPDIWQLRRE